MPETTLLVGLAVGLAIGVLLGRAAKPVQLTVLNQIAVVEEDEEEADEADAADWWKEGKEK